MYLDKADGTTAKAAENFLFSLSRVRNFFGYKHDQWAKHWTLVLEGIRDQSHQTPEINDNQTSCAHKTPKSCQKMPIFFLKFRSIGVIYYIFYFIAIRQKIDVRFFACLFLLQIENFTRICHTLGGCKQ